MRGRFFIVLAAVVATVASGCGGSSKSPAAAKDSAALQVQFVSYDVTTGHDQRVIVGLQTDRGLVSYSRVRLNFSYLGTKKQVQSGEPGPAIEASWIPVPGQKLPAVLPTEPLVVKPAAGVGVYGGDVKFDRAGFWRVTAIAVIHGNDTRGDAVFAVNDKPTAVDVGAAAPKSQNLLLGASPPATVDSRASNGPLPDAQLHRQTVAQAISSGRPTMVVISTPVYCISRFCGPITDSVGALARRHASRMNFVHLEVWRNFQKQEANRAAAEWIYRTGRGDLHEPWVYVINSRGIVTQRFDNVASDDELVAAVRQVLETS